MWRNNDALRESQKRHVWGWFDSFVMRTASKKFKTTPQHQRRYLDSLGVRYAKLNGRLQKVVTIDGEHIHTDRILLCMEFFKAYRHKTIQWCMTAYRIRFKYIDAVRRINNMGDRSFTARKADSGYFIPAITQLFAIRQRYGINNPRELMEKWYETFPQYKDTTRWRKIPEFVMLLDNMLDITYTPYSIDDDEHNFEELYATADEDEPSVWSALIS